MKVQLLGLADHVTVGGLSGPQTYKADQESQLVAFQFSGAWDEAKGHAAARAMEAAGSVVTGEAITLTKVAAIVSHLDPSLAEGGLKQAAEIADGIIAKHGGFVDLENAMPLVIELAKSRGTPHQIANFVRELIDPSYSS